MTSFRNAPYCLIILPQVRVEDPLLMFMPGFYLLSYLFKYLLNANQLAYMLTCDLELVTENVLMRLLAW